MAGGVRRGLATIAHRSRRQELPFLLVSALLLAQFAWPAVAGKGPLAGSRRGDDDAPFGRGQVNGGVHGQRSVGGLTEKVEGCFDRFDSEYMVELGRANINNKRCQAICTDRGYALSATGLIDRCFCGNDYPSIFHRVDTSLCDSPCNPDKATCFSFTCCGSKDARLLTVSWSGEMDIMLQILRQLSHDYRFNNPTFRSQIEGTFNDRVAMQSMPPPGGGDVVVVVEGAGGAAGGDGATATGAKKWGQEPPNQPMYLAVGDGCPVGWKLFDRWCYKTKWAQATTHPEAVKLCQEENAELVTVTSGAENAFVNQQLGGCQGWLGLKQMRTTVNDGEPYQLLQPTPSPMLTPNDRAGIDAHKFTSPMLSSATGMAAGRSDERQLGRKDALLWMASRFEAWRKDQEEEDKQALPTNEDQFLIEAEDAFGPTLASKSGREHFDEYYPGVQRVQSISIAFKEDGAISSFQLTYRAADGSEMAGSLHGQNDATSVMSTFRLEDGDEITRVAASFGQWRVQSLQFHIHLTNGSDVVHGVAPVTTSLLGSLGWRQLEYQPAGTIVGVFGNVGLFGNLLSLGFYTGHSMSCTKMDESGEWVRRPCRTKDEDKSQYVCEKPFLDAKRGCPREWVAWETSCYLRRRGHGMSWWDARTACQEYGSHLVAINSPSENDFINRLMGGTEGFIGYYRKQLDHGRRWHWDSYWKVKERDIEEGVTAPFSIGKSGTLQRSWTSQDASKVANLAVDDRAADHCFEMLDDGSWHLIPCNLSTAATIICERGSPNATCNECPWPGKWEPWGCTCYHREVGSGKKDVTKTWLQANQLCNAMGARLVTIRSAEENDWVREFARGAFVFRTGRLPTYIALNNLHDSEDYQWHYYDNWRSQPNPSTAQQNFTAGLGGSEETSMASDAAGQKTWQQRAPQLDRHYITWQPKRCSQMSRHGQWVRAPCEEQKASCFVCKKDRAASFISLRPQYEEWDIEVIEQPQGADLHRPPGCKCPDCFRAFLRHSLTGLYLAVDSQNLVYMTHTRDPAWSAFVLVAHPESGALAVVTPHGDAALRWGHAAAAANHPLVAGKKHGWLSGGGDGAYYGVHCEPLADGWDIAPAPPMLGGHKTMFKGQQGGNPRGHYNPHPLPIFEEDGLVVFHCTHTLSQMAWRYLRISVVAQSRDLNEPGLRECSVAVYDTTPETLSYECHLRAPGPTDDLVFLEQEALLFFDQSTYAQPRVPLPNGRVRCENGSPTETATCTFAYGQGLTLSRQFRVNWGYTISDVITHRVNAAVTETALFRVLPRNKEMSSMRNGKEMDELDELKATIKEKVFKHPRGTRSIRPTPAPQVTDLTISATELAEFVNAFSVAYNNFYEILITKAYVETRNWQLSVPVAPHTTDTIQFWLSSENLYYRWRALFAARGGFTISTFGVPIGSHHSLGDLTYFRDLFFFIFGSYEFPSEAEIIITVNDVPGDGWPLPTPETSQGDRVGSVVRHVK